MSHMTVNQRSQFERVDLSVPTTGVRVRDSRPVIAYTVLAMVVLGALTYAAVEVLDWANGIVLGAIVATAVGAMIALSPNRRS